MSKGESVDNNGKHYTTNITNKEVLHQKDPLSGILREQSMVLHKLGKNTEREQEHNDNLAEWHEIAFIMDRVFLFFYVFTTFLTSVIFMAKMTSG